MGLRDSWGGFAPTAPARVMVREGSPVTARKAYSNVGDSAHKVHDFSTKKQIRAFVRGRVRAGRFCDTRGLTCRRDGQHTDPVAGAVAGWLHRFGAAAACPWSSRGPGRPPSTIEEPLTCGGRVLPGTFSRRRRSKPSPGNSQAPVPPRKGNSGKQPGTPWLTDGASMSRHRACGISQVQYRAGRNRIHAAPQVLLERWSSS